MISYDQILMEIERQLATAHKTTDEGQMREALSAIRSLCEVALNSNQNKGELEKVIPKMLSSTEVQSLTSFEGKPLEEKDANGGSLFDF